MNAPHLPWSTRAAILVRLLGIQGVWNYETMLGNGIAFAMEPALRQLPGGRGGEAYRAAMLRHSGYFNAHPYLASVAVGALVRAELDGTPPEQIDRFRVAAPGRSAPSATGWSGPGGCRSARPSPCSASDWGCPRLESSCSS